MTIWKWMRMPAWSARTWELGGDMLIMPTGIGNGRCGENSRENNHCHESGLSDVGRGQGSRDSDPVPQRDQDNPNQKDECNLHEHSGAATLQTTEIQILGRTVAIQSQTYFEKHRTSDAEHSGCSQTGGRTDKGTAQFAKNLSQNVQPRQEQQSNRDRSQHDLKDSDDEHRPRCEPTEAKIQNRERSYRDVKLMRFHPCQRAVLVRFLLSIDWTIRTRNTRASRP
ncbi:similar to DNA-directed DNA polymerase [Rhodopirellula baltica SH 1]|uniref:Similar to DNA-directed DNA polymerase n=1 Tax=Rhodopirellula baltica (strain DSM 10527 / NCIMB 13988 / SH1) TaxID=243090 RepID=Q7UEQ4_RHOBA|nr:similar to DNA-directed DNA polymerase [Rhodopirellula baltica SH 1]